METDWKFLILICKVWSDGQGSEISDPYLFCVMEMDWKFLILVCGAMDMNQKFLILLCLCDGNGSEISDPYLFVTCGALDMDHCICCICCICNVWSDGQGSEISDPYSFCVMEMDWGGYL